MNCPRCHARLEARSSHGLTAFVCQEHGIWQDWPTIHALIRMSQAEEDDRTTALIEGFVWGRLI